MEENETGRWEKQARWVYYDKEKFQVYRGLAAPGVRARAELVDEGRHGLALQHRVPLFPLIVSEGLWLMNKAALLQLEHLTSQTL